MRILQQLQKPRNLSARENGPSIPWRFHNGLVSQPLHLAIAGQDWTDEWSCMCDDECPHCGARDMSPADSDNLTHVIEKRDQKYVVLWSPETAEHSPDYCELRSFPSRKQAMNWLSVDNSDVEV